VIVVDRALEERAEAGKPIRVAVVGAGFMGRPLTKQITRHVPGMEVVAVVSRRAADAERAFADADVDEVELCASAHEIERAVSAGRRAVTDDPAAACEAGCVDAVVEVTGAVEYGAAVVLRAIQHGKHVVLMNAEVDGTVGPILKRYADNAEVVYTACDGDQPGVQMNLFRFVVGMGLTPLVVGNIKGLQDPYRTPTTQVQFANRWHQKPHMVTSFADGTKISFEQAVVANGIGFHVARRGMSGHEFDGHIDEATRLYDIDELREQGGIMDYVVGARPGPGVFVFAESPDPEQRFYLELFKLGTGPLYSFYAPYHLCHLEAPFSVARAVLFGDAVLAPRGRPYVEVVTTAKSDLATGTCLDGLGGYSCYGQSENADVARAERLLPMGVAEGCRLRRDVPRDQVLTYEDVELPPNRLVDRLRAEQEAAFA
jgi:predicted homoserine dehydrogenase-like protein